MKRIAELLSKNDFGKNLNLLISNERADFREMQVRDIMGEANNCVKSGNNSEKCCFNKILSYTWDEDKLDIHFLCTVLISVSREIMQKIVEDTAAIYNKESLKLLKEKNIWVRQIPQKTLKSNIFNGQIDYQKMWNEKLYEIMLQHNLSSFEEREKYKLSYELRHRK